MIGQGGMGIGFSGLMLSRNAVQYNAVDEMKCYVMQCSAV